MPNTMSHFSGWELTVEICSDILHTPELYKLRLYFKQDV